MIYKSEVVIIGDSYTALTMAIFLMKNNIKVILIGKNFREKKSKNNRLFAIAKASQQILASINIVDYQAQPINQIRVVDDNSYSKIDFHPHSIGLENFGCMVLEQDLKKELKNSFLAEIKYDYQLLTELNIAKILVDDYKAIVLGSLKNQDKLYNIEIQSSLLIIADGSNSSARASLPFLITKTEFFQQAIVADITHKSWPHSGVAVEKFTKLGPIAILPQANQHKSSIVWIERDQSVKQLKKLPQSLLLEIIEEKLQGYLGKIESLKPFSFFPLTSIMAKKLFYKRAVLIGDAAHTIHPLAGQGFNLALRDIKELSKLLIKQKIYGLDLGCLMTLNSYQKAREVDIALMNNVITILNSLFLQEMTPIKYLRRLGMKLLDKNQLIKKHLMLYASGFIE